jgi:hypothetical protein
MTPKGPGEAIIFRDPGPDHDDLWTVLLRNGEVWTFKNKEVRGVENVTEGRPIRHYVDPQGPLDPGKKPDKECDPLHRTKKKEPVIDPTPPSMSNK